MDKLDIRIFDEYNYISVGTLRPEFIDFFNTHGLNNTLIYNTPIIFWKERVEHAAEHKDEFSSDIMYQICFEEIPEIIYHPDYISIHPNRKSVSFIRDYSSNHVNVAVRVTANGGLAFRTMYPLIDATLTHYMDMSHAWSVKYREDGTPIIIDNSNNN